MSKKYVTSDMPRLQQSSARPTNYTKVISKRVKPVKHWKLTLEEHRNNRAVKTVERAKPIPIEISDWLARLTS
mgnify:CR=1 FL=1